MSQPITSSSLETRSLAKSAIVIALYLMLTLLVAPVAYGPVQFRISEILNYLGLYHRRYIYAVTIGVFLANFYQNGLVDMIVGSLTTLVSFYVSLWLGKQLIRLNNRYHFFKGNPELLRYVAMAIVFATFCFTIAAMLVMIGAESAFWPVYASIFVSELIVMLLGIPVMYTVSKRVDLTQ